MVDKTGHKCPGECRANIYSYIISLTSALQSVHSVQRRERLTYCCLILSSLLEINLLSSMWARCDEVNLNIRLNITICKAFEYSSGHLITLSFLQEEKDRNKLGLQLTVFIGLIVPLFSWLINQYLFGLQNVDQCLPKPKMTSSNVLFTTQIYSVFCQRGETKPENIHI